MTTETFNTDQKAAHIAAFDAREADLEAMVAHLREEHGWIVPGHWGNDRTTLLAVHGISHYNAGDLSPHKRGTHTHHFMPYCDKAIDGEYCDHTSCMEMMHEMCEGCYVEYMDGRGRFDPVLCKVHGWTYIVDAGSNSGFAGEGVWWENWACGHGEFEEGHYSE